MFLNILEFQWSFCI